MFNGMMHDLKFAFRIAPRQHAVTVMAVLILSLGIGATTGVFSHLSALLIRPLPFAEPKSLVSLQRFPALAVLQSPSAFRAWGSANPYLKNATAHSNASCNLVAGGRAVRVNVAQVSANFFDLLGVPMTVGRRFRPDEDQPGGNRSAVVSETLWRVHFGSDPKVIGTVVRIDGTAFEIVGVTERGVDFPDKAQVWVPTIFEPQLLSSNGVLMFSLTGRIRGGLSHNEAESRVREEAVRLAPALARAPEGQKPQLIGLNAHLAGAHDRPLWVLFGSVVFILLVCCANVANLLLTRTLERTHEFAVRSAVGATPSRLRRQLLIESLLLAAVSSVGGIFVTVWVARALARLLPLPLEAQMVQTDWRVFVFGVLLVFVTALLFGTIPAWIGSRLGPHAPRLTSRSPVSHNWSTQSLVAAQVAIAVMLTTAGSALGMAFWSLIRTDLGFDAANVASARVSFTGTRYAERPDAYAREALDRLSRISGVQASGATSYLPFLHEAVGLVGHKLDSTADALAGMNVAVTPGYFSAMRTPILQGRDFTAADTVNSERVVIVNEEFARRAGAGDVRLLLGRMLTSEGRPARIVGIVPSARMWGPQYTGQPQVYFPLAQRAWPFLTFVVRAESVGNGLLAHVSGQLQLTDTFVPVYDSRMLADRLETILARPQFYTFTIVGLAGLALLLSILGVYGVTAYIVRQRMYSYGVHLAMGASIGQLRWQALRTTMKAVAIGALVGAASTLWIGSAVAALESAAEMPGWATTGLIVGIIGSSAAIAIWRAASAISRADPANLLRGR